MELIVFDLDGTLLNKESAISDYTSETLRLLAEHQIAYTVATGRTLHSARSVLGEHDFLLPQAYKNGVMTWHPEEMRFTKGAMLTMSELDHVFRAFRYADVTPLVFTLDEKQRSTVYHAPLKSGIEQELVSHAGLGDNLRTRALDELPGDAVITHVNAIGPCEAIETVLRSVNEEPQLVAYSGTLRDDRQWRWLDLHHSEASKGGAIADLRDILGIERVICFGDSDNDLSMFAVADESYAPANANDAIKAAATAVIGHHDEEGIARFLRERFKLN
ncbi:HAD family hydrolase [Pseudohalioglobus lutimaris]|uniref:Haloacid dehalogenase n=1 Tax=Pseudohalioglobus lutimaris TaxID=1737061 RepID=A0A2N5X7Z5_9GAMM|nr:HAD family hydrolase [Pseudohalioglobus lutimaris]PLW70616.1 haloacid dehalogenase [Pseudohalioglobus lutimaris]